MILSRCPSPSSLRPVRRADSIFDLFKIPAFDPANRPLRRARPMSKAWRPTSCLGGGFHALATVGHALVCKDGVLGRMILALRRA